MAPEIAGIPEIYVERFVEAYEAFVDQVRLMVQKAVKSPIGDSQELVSEWHSRVLPLLEERLAGIKSAVARFHAGDATPLVRCADDATGLAKSLDLFSFDFAGPEGKDALESLLTPVITTAYQVCNAAGLP
jgi:hypothetical protein